MDAWGSRGPCCPELLPRQPIYRRNFITRTLAVATGARGTDPGTRRTVLAGVVMTALRAEAAMKKPREKRELPQIWWLLKSR